MYEQESVAFVLFSKILKEETNYQISILNYVIKAYNSNINHFKYYIYIHIYEFGYLITSKFMRSTKNSTLYMG